MSDQSSEHDRNGPTDLIGHEYDGIREYDNPTPGWWHAIFLGSVVFGIFYAFMVHLSPLTRTRYDRLASVQTRALDRQFGELRTIELGEGKVARILEREEWVSMGASIFEERCVLCHDSGGRGKAGLGVNLTDGVYKNVDSVAGIIGVLQNGIGVAMPSQRANLNDTEMALVTAYVVSLRGTNHPEGIPPDGVEIPPFFSTPAD